MRRIDSLYRVRFTASDRVKKERVWRVLCQDFFQNYISKDATVLDIACGYGEFIRNIEAGEKIAIDLNPDSKSFLPDSVRFYYADAADMSMIGDSSVDVCFSSNFFEHLADKNVMDDVLSEVRRVLKNDGMYIAMQPNLRVNPVKYWDYYDHIIPLTDLSCKEAFLKGGFVVEELIARFVPFSTDSKLPQWPVFIKIYLFLKPLWRFFGGQFLIIGRK